MSDPLSTACQIPRAGLAAQGTLRRRQLALGLGAVALGASLGSSRAWGQRTGPVAEPFAWPEIALLDGPVLRATDWRDHAAVLVFWATHCPFCRRHNAHVEKLHRAVAGQPLRVLTLATDRDPEKVRRYMREQGYGFAVSMASAEPLRLLLGLRRTIPTTIGISRSGRVGMAMPGEMFEEDVLAMAALASSG